MDWTRDLSDWPNSDLSRQVRVSPHVWHVQESGTGPTVLLISMKGDETPDQGVLQITVTTPMDVVTTKVVDVFDDAACGFSPQPPGCN